MTLRPGAADGIGTVMQAFESQPTWVASGWLLVGPQEVANRQTDKHWTKRDLFGGGKYICRQITEVEPCYQGWKNLGLLESF